MEEKLGHLRDILRWHAPLLIAYSGGVDSACLLAVAHKTLGSETLGVIADSPSLPRQALSDALAVARSFGAVVEVLRTDEMANESYTSNPVNRCYFCKSELFLKLDALAQDRQFAAIAYGENADDALHFRPGKQAAAEFAVIAPLKEAGLTKAEIRGISREMNLPTADAPAQPCLSSRIPHGTPVTLEALRMVEQSEAFVRGLGFRVFRVRHIVDPASSGRRRARVQIAPDELTSCGDFKEVLAGGLIAIGYDEVELDPAGYRAPA